MTCRLRGSTLARSRCTVRMSKAAARRVTRVLLTRRGTLYASARPRRGSTVFTLGTVRTLRAARSYTLTIVRVRPTGEATAARSTVRIV